MAHLAGCRRAAKTHKGRPFTCRACGAQACWLCALSYWPERVLPASRADVEAAESEGRLLGCCSRACRERLPVKYGPMFRLQET
jgi:hypothetical protein